MAPICMLSRSLLTKISASELSRKFVKSSALLVGQLWKERERKKSLLFSLYNKWIEGETEKNTAVVARILIDLDCCYRGGGKGCNYFDRCAVCVCLYVSITGTGTGQLHVTERTVSNTMKPKKKTQRFFT